MKSAAAAAAAKLLQLCPTLCDPNTSQIFVVLSYALYLQNVLYDYWLGFS